MIQAHKIEEQVYSLTLPGLPPGKAVIPNYDGYSICAVPDLIRSFLGERVEGSTVLIDAVHSIFPSTAKKIVLFILDGLGFYHLLDLLERFPELYLNRLIERGVFIPITSVFPATTATALTTYSTGLTPQEHGMVGYRLYLKETSAITNMVRLSLLGNSKVNSAVEAGIDLQSFIPGPTLYERLKQLGVESHVMLNRHIASSGLSSLLYDGSARLHPVVSFSDMLVVTRRVLQKAREKAFLSLYWGGTDAIAHTYGPWTQEFTAELRTIDSAIERELKGQVKETLLVISSDHGFVPMRGSNYKVIAEDSDLMGDLLLPPVGEPRASYLFVRKGRKQAVAELVTEHFGEDLVCLDARVALQAGLFGRGEVKPEVYDRIGDLIVVSTGEVALHHPYKDAARLKGMHGGLTSQEMLVPLLVSPL